MRRAFFALVALVAASLALPAYAGVLIVIDRGSQSMTVSVNGTVQYRWVVSTGQGWNWTRPGTFGVQSMKRMHYSSRYNNAPMPHSIFYDGNRAIHGTTHVERLGTQASKGCVRLAPGNAATLYALVANNRNNTRIIVR